MDPSSICGKISAGLSTLIREAPIHSGMEIGMVARLPGLLKVISFLVAHPEFGFSRFVGIFVDEQNGAWDEGFSLSYLFRQDGGELLCRIRVLVGKGEILPTVSRIVPGAGWSERLAWEMFGIPFSGHHDLRVALRPRVDIGDAGNRGGDVVVVGPRHEGLVFQIPLQLHLEGEVVRHAVVHPGGSLPTLDCCIEDVLPNISSVGGAVRGGFFARLACALAIEKLAGVKVSLDVRLVRVLLSEMARVVAHLQAIAEMNGILGQEAAVVACREAQDMLLPVFLRHQDGVVAGGVSRAFPQEDMLVVSDFCRRFAGLPDRLLDVYPSVRLRMAGIGRMESAMSMLRGCSGPVLRATGAKCDLRSQDPDYQTIPFRMACASGGDSLARHLVRCGEMSVSMEVIAACLAGREHGVEETVVVLPDVFPEGGVYSAVEGAQGETGACVHVRDGRVSSLRLRIPVGFHLAALPSMLRGHMFDDVPVVMASLGLGGGSGGGEG